MVQQEELTQDHINSMVVSATDGFTTAQAVINQMRKLIIGLMQVVDNLKKENDELKQNLKPSEPTEEETIN